MRSGPIAVVALVAAVLGGLAVLVVGKTAGWLDRTSTTIVVRQGAPSAPEASAAAVRPDSRPLAGNGFDPARIYTRRSAGVVTIYAFFTAGSATEEAQGSGFVASASGYVLTNSHVIANTPQEGSATSPEGASGVYVEFQNHDRIPAKIVGWDLFDDVGVLKVDPRAHVLSPLPLGDSSALTVGAPVAAIGSPFGNENSLAVGVISATGRSIASLTSPYDLIDAIQIDAPINHGNSGGPLLDARGRVIGINAQIRSNSGNAEGVGFAVPINSAKSSMRQLIAHGHVAYAYVGISTQTLTPSMARRFGYPVRSGAAVESVVPGSAGARAGLRGGGDEQTFNGIRFRPGGDLIVAIDGRPVRTADELVRIVAARLRPGEVSFFTIYRHGRKRTIAVLLDDRPADPSAP